MSSRIKSMVHLPGAHAITQAHYFGYAFLFVVRPVRVSATLSAAFLTAPLA